MNTHISKKQLFLNHVGQTSAFPMALEVQKAADIYLYGPDGKKYIDLISGIAVSSLGHNHPRVVEAVRRQVADHMHVMAYGEFVQSTQVLAAKAICDTLPDRLDNVFFVNSGSEAVEGAMKLAKRFTRKGKIIACFNSYHGSTHGAMSLGSTEPNLQPFAPLVPGISHIQHGSIDDLQQIDDQTAAVIIETVQGEAGIRLASKEYFQALRSKCDQTGTLLVLDEIQTGFGRTGTFWGFEHYDIVPDIITTAKAMGGGMPLGAFIAPKNIMQTLQTDPMLGHITTFGGHPVSCAASLATLQELEETKIYLSAEAKAQLFLKYLRHPDITTTRHLGLMMAIEFDSYARVAGIIEKAMDFGLISDWFLYCDRAIRIAPPLTISDEQIKAACDILLKAIDETTEN